MDVVRKSHTTEIIIAIITAITGLTVAVIANWDKIMPKTTVSAPIEKEPEPEPEPDTDILNDGPYSLLLQASIDAKKQSNDNWTMEHFHYGDLLTDSSNYVSLNLDAGYTYAFNIFTLDSNKVFDVSLHFADKEIEPRSFKLTTGTEISISLEKDVTALFIRAADIPVLLPYGLLITYKKT